MLSIISSNICHIDVDLSGQSNLVIKQLSSDHDHRHNVAGICINLAYGLLM